MSEDFLKNPLSLFDIKGKTAIVTGASGAFGALSAKVLAGAGANAVLAAGGANALKKVAGECEARDGLHIADDHFLPEIIEPVSGDPLPPGREGELVFTTLTKRAMPLIRYRTGDITTFHVEPCRCGRTSVRMARVPSRTQASRPLRRWSRPPRARRGAVAPGRRRGCTLGRGRGTATQRDRDPVMLAGGVP